MEAEANDIALIMLSDVVDLDDPFVAVVDLAPSGLLPSTYAVSNNFS